MLVAEYVVLELSGECALFAVAAVVSELKRALVAIPSVAQSGQARHLALHADFVGRRNEQQSEGRCRPTAGARYQRRGKSAESRLRSSRKVAEKRSDASPLAAGAAASRRHARLRRVVKLFDGVDKRRIERKRFKDGARMRAGFHECVGDEKPPRRLARIIERGKARMREVNIGETIVALAPRLGGAFDIAQHPRRYRPAISRRQQRQHTQFVTIDGFSAGAIPRSGAARYRRPGLTLRSSASERG